MDGVVNASDIAISLNGSGPISSSLVARIALALGGQSNGMEVTILPSAEAGLSGWFGAVWTCITCLLNCGSSYGAAWACRDQLKQAECDCWDLPDLFDVAECLDDLRLNFLSDCIDAVAVAAGDCGQCILDCHPLAP